MEGVFYKNMNLGFKIKNLIKMDLGYLMLLTAPFFILFVYLFRYSTFLQFEVLSLAALVYLIIGIAHHYHKRTLSLEIIVEYVLISGLVLIILQGFLI